MSQLKHTRLTLRTCMAGCHSLKMFLSRMTALKPVAIGARMVSKSSPSNRTASSVRKPLGRPAEVSGSARINGTSCSAPLSRNLILEQSTLGC